MRNLTVAMKLGLGFGVVLVFMTLMGLFALNQINSAVTQQNASASEELAATAEEMSGQAMQLQELMAYFTLDSRRTAANGRAQAHALAA